MGGINSFFFASSVAAPYVEVTWRVSVVKRRSGAASEMENTKSAMEKERGRGNT